MRESGFYPEKWQASRVLKTWRRITLHNRTNVSMLFSQYLFDLFSALFFAIRTYAMRKGNIGIFRDVSIRVLPMPFVVADSLAPRAHHDKVFEHLDLRRRLRELLDRQQEICRIGK